MTTAAFYAPVLPASGGFGMYERGGVYFAWPDPEDRGDGVDDIASFLEVSRDNGWEVEPTGDLDGRIVGQNGAQVYHAIRGDEEMYFMLWCEEVKG